MPATTFGAGLEVTGRAQLSPRLTEVTMRTPSLDFPVRVRILVPGGYSAERKRRYPVLYLLHGSFDTSASWTDKGEAERITAGQPLIVVMPPTTGKGNAGGWASDWRNEGRGGPPKWEAFLIDELIPWVDRNMRALPERGKRAIAGLSMGGFGAMSLAARHPDLFVAAGSFSGAVDTNYSPAQAVVQGETVADGGTTPDAIWGPRAVDEIYWRAHNPWDLAENLRGMALSIRTGNGQPGPYDSPGPYTEPVEYGVHEMSVSFHDRLAALAIPHVWDDYGPGTHSWPYWQREPAGGHPSIHGRLRPPGRGPEPVHLRVRGAELRRVRLARGPRAVGDGVQRARRRERPGPHDARERLRLGGHPPPVRAGVGSCGDARAGPVPERAERASRPRRPPAPRGPARTE
jgi:S-formylglutathione hydrolase FrmB